MNQRDMKFGDFQWMLVNTADGLTLVCTPLSANGREYHFTLSITRGLLFKYYGQISDSEGETIDMTDSDLLMLMSRMEDKVFELESAGAEDVAS